MSEQKPESQITCPKERADVIMGLYQTACTNFERRRSYEWKLSFGIWTAIAAFAGLVLTRRIPGGHFTYWGCPRYLFIVFGSLVWLIHLHFQWQIKISNAVDQKRALVHEAKLLEMTGMRYGDIAKPGRQTNVQGETVQEDAKKRDKRHTWGDDKCLRQKACDWNQAINEVIKRKGWEYIAIHVLITLVLLAGAFFATWLPGREDQGTTGHYESYVQAFEKASDAGEREFIEERLTPIGAAINHLETERQSGKELADRLRVVRDKRRNPVEKRE